MTTTISGSAISSPFISGMVCFFGSVNPPEGWLLCDGRAVSRTTYPVLFAAIGTTFGAGDGFNTFNLPDMRGRFPRSWDDGAGRDTGRAFGSVQSDAIRNIVGTFDGNIDDGQSAKTGAFYFTGSGFQGSNGDGRASGGVIGFDASRVVPTAAENRPVNVALLACIKF